MYRVIKRIEISGAHKLSLPYESKCRGLHGHNWIITVFCQSETLDENGIGRPSTYAATISTITSREYVKRQNKTLYPTELGEVTTKLMEERFDRVSDAVSKLSEALEAYRSVQDELSILNSYYGSDEWKQDFADDEAGLLPKDLKRGVLSEDGVWDVMSENQVLLVQMRELLRATAFDISQE